jgi:hypothetical protein
MGKGMSIFAPDQKCSQPMNAQRRADAAKEPNPPASGNGASAYLSSTEFSRHTGHDRCAAATAYDPRAAFEWAYHDESGAPLFHSVRTPEKKF